MVFMPAFRLILAMVVLNSTEPLPPYIPPLVRSELTMIFLQAELMDPREVRYVFSKDYEFESDLRMMQRRIKDLENAPSLSVAVIFPEITIVNDLLLFNRAYRRYLDDCLPIYPHRKELRYAKEENDILYQVWDCVRDARCEYYYIHIRRQALCRLKSFLGEEDFWKANLPPHVPYWRFTVVR